MTLETDASAKMAAAAHDDHYPRPQLIRQAWCDLTGVWRFAFDDDERGMRDGWFRAEHRLDAKIVVPFPPESEASGIGVSGIHDVVWYQRDLSEEDILEAGFDSDVRPQLLLHFGAVDYRCSVWLDGHLLGSHEGGHTPFTLRLPHLGGDSRHILTVRAEDRAADIGQPRGKQDWRLEPHVIWYRRTTGIWQPVWLESTPENGIEKIHWTADVVNARVECEIRLLAPPLSEIPATITLSTQGAILGKVTITLRDQRTHISVDLPRQRNGQAYDELLWSPKSPNLIDAVVTAGDDKVASYFGIRTTSVAEGDFLLNDRPLYLRSVLSQGYWPASHLAAPTPDALREEVEWILKLGFNSARVHQKMEDPRFLYWADRLGLLLWAEAPAAFEFSATSIQRTTTEWLAVVDRDRSHPSIVTWVPMNESWGIQHAAHDSRQAAFAQALTALTRALDATRPVISNDGWEHVDSDIFTVHDYEADEAVLRKPYSADDLRASLLSRRGPEGRRLSIGGSVPMDVPIMVTEFGGVNFSPGVAPEDAWGYSSAVDSDDFRRRVTGVFSGIQSSDGLAGFCYTQLTDTLQETNGLLTEDRVPKLDVDVIREIVTHRSRRG